MTKVNIQLTSRSLLAKIALNQIKQDRHDGHNLVLDLKQAHK